MILKKNFTDLSLNQEKTSFAVIEKNNYAISFLTYYKSNNNEHFENFLL